MRGADDRQAKMRWRRRAGGMRSHAAGKTEQSQKTAVSSQSPNLAYFGALENQRLASQNTGVSRQTPQTSLRASHISPIVT